MQISLICFAIEKATWVLGYGIHECLFTCVACVTKLCDVTHVKSVKLSSHCRTIKEIQMNS